MNRNATPVSRWSSPSRFSTCAWVTTSRALTASSQTISFGLMASARAIAIRCRWPPLKAFG